MHCGCIILFDRAVLMAMTLADCAHCDFAGASRTGNALGVQEIGGRHLDARCLSLMGGKEVCKIVEGSLSPAVDQGFWGVRKFVGLQRHMSDINTDKMDHCSLCYD